jgi:hypothetical protein
VLQVVIARLMPRRKAEHRISTIEMAEAMAG